MLSPPDPHATAGVNPAFALIGGRSSQTDCHAQPPRPPRYGRSESGLRFDRGPQFANGLPCSAPHAPRAGFALPKGSAARDPIRCGRSDKRASACQRLCSRGAAQESGLRWGARRGGSPFGGAAHRGRAAYGGAVARRRRFFPRPRPPRATSPRDPEPRADPAGHHWPIGLWVETGPRLELAPAKAGAGVTGRSTQPPVTSRSSPRGRPSSRTSRCAGR
jgi:hypothetical protein